VAERPPPDVDVRFARARERLQTIGVTGTNGKTTTTAMIASIVRASGEPDARVTTVGAFVGDERCTRATATLEFLDAVERSVLAGVRTIAVEMTSLALAGGLAKRWPAQVAVFTNLTRDHFDYHPSPEAYLASKAQLFVALRPGQVAVLHADDPSSALLEEVLADGVAVKRFSRTQTADLEAHAVEVSRAGTTFTTRCEADAALDGLTITLAAIGAHHVENALGAMLATRALGYEADAMQRGLARFEPVAGRFQIVASEPLVVVDYAHTPDGLEKTLETARRLVIGGGALTCVFGCGGERDRGKRPLMGAVAHRLADHVVVTSDNARREDPSAIARAIREGASGPGADWIEQLDRRAAIHHAIDTSTREDVIVIAGRGHEAHQEIGGARIPFSDADVAAEAIASRAPR
jgi:UDP-N-acetylmuramoyl-L-alanyl-D-glutamate--2,6-diaminopimelate ligase